MGKLGGLLAGATPNMVATNQTNATEAAAPAEPAAPAAGGGMPAVLASLQGAGVSPSQVQSTLPLVAGLLKDKAGVDVYKTLGVEAPSGGGGGWFGGLRGMAKDFKNEALAKE